MFAMLVLAGVPLGVARADSYAGTIHVFKEAGKSGTFFAKAYGYAVFPTIGGAGFIVGGVLMGSAACTLTAFSRVTPP
jgi:hypothetical protein